MSTTKSVQHAQPTDLETHNRKVQRILQTPELTPEPEPVYELLAPEEPLTASAQMYLDAIGYTIPPRPASYGTRYSHPTYAVKARVRPASTPTGLG